MSALSLDPRTARLVQAYEALSPTTLPALMQLYGEAASFKDPFNEVRGRAAIQRIFAHMFEVLVAPRFTVLHTVTEADMAFLSWDFEFRREADGKTWHIHGASCIRYGAQGQVLEHRDYWDAAEELYEKLPLIGRLMRWLRGRLATPAQG